MKKLYLLALVSMFTFTTQVATAGPVDSGPPAQQQKDAVTDSTATGNYLEDEAANAVNEDTTQASDMDSNKNKDKHASPKPLKGKSHNKEPEKGGVDVK